MSTTRRYRPTEAKYKGGAREMYITYDLDQQTRSGTTRTYPKVRRVYVSGVLKSAQTGSFQKRTGREVKGVRIEHEQTREARQRKESHQTFVQIVEVPPNARNVRFHEQFDDLPEQYQTALQRVS